VLVVFGGKERYIGEAAVPQARTNFTNAVSQIKRLIGRKFSEPEVHHELDCFLNYRVVPLPNDDIGIEVRRVAVSLAAVAVFVLVLR
jgi:molecular chaperone DnaK (HSP70)